MTVSSTTNRKTFAGDDATTSFGTSPVVFFETSDLQAYVTDDTTGATELLVEGTDYTATGGDGSTGTISLAGGSDPWGALLSGTTLVILRVLEATQEVDLVNNDISDAEVLETALDRLTMLLQQNDTTNARALRQADSDPADVDTEVVTTGKAGFYLRLNAAGDAFELAEGDLNESTFTQSGTGAIERSVTSKLGEWLSVTDFTGTDPTGVSSSTAGFQAAIDTVASGSPVFIYVPTGTYKLSTNVSANGRIPSWLISPGATFTGVGTLPSISVGHFGDLGYKNAGLVAQRGTSADINSSKSPLGIMKKVSGATTSGDESNAVFVVMGERRTSTVSGARMQGFWSEVEDYAGGAGTFVEGGRFGSTAKTGSDCSSYGVIGLAGCDSGVTSMDYMVAFEGVVSNNKTDAPALASFSTAAYSACFVATSHFGTKLVDAGFATNPFNNTGSSVATYRTGFLVTEDSVLASGQAFASRATVAVGLNFLYGTHSNAVLLTKNNEVIVRARNAAGNADHNLLFYNSSNQVVIGTDAVSVKLAVVDNAVANPLVRDIVYGAADSGSRGAGFRALQVPN